MITYDTYVDNLSFALRFNWNRMISLYFYIYLSHKIAKIILYTIGYIDLINKI